MKTTASAPGKIILFGEHAVVYGEPAIAVPVTQLQATAVVEDAPQPGVRLRAPDLGEDVWLDEAAAEHPLAAAVRTLLAAIESPMPVPPSPFPFRLKITVTSSIPIASGLGSGAAIAAALIRALARHLGRHDLATDERVSQMTYEVERIHHGTPSGIDNTVVSYGRPVFFIRAGAPVKPRPVQVLEPFTTGRPFHFLIGDSGVRAPTLESVSDVRAQWEADPSRMEELFAACGRLAIAARQALETGDTAAVGRLMTDNHTVLQNLTVSSEPLDRLVAAALTAGAFGAKLSGGGRGGNMIALVEGGQQKPVTTALLAAGALRVLETTLE